MELIHHSLDSAQPCRFQTSGRPTIEPTFSLLVHESMGVLCEVSEIADQMVKTWMEETFGDWKITNMAGLRKCGPARSVQPNAEASTMDHGLHRFWRGQR
jgi:hypothetical protein